MALRDPLRFISCLYGSSGASGQDQMHLAHSYILSTEPRAWHMVDVQYIDLLKE